jgi:phospholipase/carboxylesterase
MLLSKNTAVWYDKISLGPELPEDIISINGVAEEVNTLVEKEKEVLGDKYRSKVIVGGFSMGGSLALHLGYRVNRDLAGIFALSSFLPPDSTVYDVN